jgi:hypothetical protein
MCTSWSGGWSCSSLNSSSSSTMKRWAAPLSKTWRWSLGPSCLLFLLPRSYEYFALSYSWSSDSAWSSMLQMQA